MSYQLAYLDKQGNWNVDRSPWRTYITRQEARQAIEALAVKTGVKIVGESRVAILQRGHSMLYVSDLPGCYGTVRVKPDLGSERNSDWGFSPNSTEAISLSPYWQIRYRKYLRDTRQEGGVL